MEEENGKWHVMYSGEGYGQEIQGFDTREAAEQFRDAVPYSTLCWVVMHPSQPVSEVSNPAPNV